ncbi:tetraacyldisaccharide 4'-kinase [Flammeovirga agarivorans]|uniref:Tetraacyldisaccharide 4'-kinase n=1 Tax=Flammeovirga agarivorans TaxID=2726742 RepID=A0A7X8XWL5_9BACT|nr:tetraacyldisaccharide 4'-kinase [Flammeovirga agarivorans]NLR92417.1 tetraacyldisaccharide 4'-kinase [Flammeovirga agarivorans]
MNFLLKPLSVIYDAITYQRNKSYDNNASKTFNFDLPIISVGNLSVGGTGKTPFVEFLIQYYSENKKVGVLSRGYGRKTKGPIRAHESSTAKEIGDEPMQYHSKYDDVEVVVSEQRVMGVPFFENTELIILDDAYQHRAIGRNVNIMLSDSSKPFFQDHVLPYGRLRERREGAERAQIIIFTKVDEESFDQSNREEFISQSKKYSKGNVFFTSIYYGEPYSLHNQKKVNLPDEVILLTSIANPNPLIREVEKYSSISKHYKFRDHYSFTEKTIERIENELPKGSTVVITEKDAVKLKDITTKSELKFIVMPILPKVLFDQEDELFHCINSLLN